MNEIQRYRVFLDSGKTERECVQEIIKLAEKEGYRNIEDVSSVSAGTLGCGSNPSRIKSPRMSAVKFKLPNLTRRPGA